MVCTYCSAQTKVTNSRSRDGDTVIWRRRACTSCGAVFTTHEDALLGSSFVVIRNDGGFSPLRKEVLFISIYESCKHREQPIEDAWNLTDTIIKRALASPNNDVGSVPIGIIKQSAQIVLQAFDQPAYTYYTAYYVK